MPTKLNLVINRGQFNQVNTQYSINRINHLPVTPSKAVLAKAPPPKAVLAKAPPPADRMSLKQAMGPNLGCKSCGG